MRPLPAIVIVVFAVFAIAAVVVLHYLLGVPRDVVVTVLVVVGLGATAWYNRAEIGRWRRSR